MQSRSSIYYSAARSLLLREDGQNLIEYALLVGLIAFGATAGMQTAALGVNTVFTTVAATLRSATG